MQMFLQRGLFAVLLWLQEAFFRRSYFFLLLLLLCIFLGGGGEGDVILRKKVLVRCEKQDAKATIETTAADLVFVFEREKKCLT